MSLISTILSGQKPTIKGSAHAYFVEEYRDKQRHKPFIKPKQEHNMLRIARENKELVLKFVRQRKTNADNLTEKTGLSRSTVKNMTDTLISEGLVECDKSARPWRFSATKKGKTA